jgi:hypothetical protein
MGLPSVALQRVRRFTVRKNGWFQSKSAEIYSLAVSPGVVSALAKIQALPYLRPIRNFRP